MANEEEVRVDMKFRDEYTDGVKQARDMTEGLDRSLEDAGESSAEANLRFLATVEAVDRLGGGVSKIRGGLEDLGIVSGETAEQLRKVEGAADLMVGTAEIAIVSMEAWTRATNNQKIALIGVASAAAAVGTAMVAMNAESEDQRKIFSALTGVTAGLAAAEFTLAAAKAAGWTASAGPASPAMAAVIAGSLVATAAAIATYVVASRKAAEEAEAGLQTGPGVIKEAEVLASGQIADGIRVDAGEAISIRAARPTATQAILGESRSMHPAIREMNVTIIGAFNPWDPAENRKAAEVLGENIVRRIGGRLSD